ncbi:MAG TPA: Sir2 family NAD-dependent protein deacetylase [Candidatus Binatia bacterium]|nr:Sir2 family NAD-dependent protein deacetylase [Candidatus Binatia bacterium]
MAPPTESRDDAAYRAAARALVGARYAIGLTGAGLSVESGIPPFRGPGGLWTKHGEPPLNGYELFLADPKRAWEQRLNPSGPMRELAERLEAARPNAGHKALVELEEMGLLRCLVTQNIDDLHRRAGQRELAEIHGNALLVRCTRCVSRWPRQEISLATLPPICDRCGGILKSDTVSFGEPIPPDVLDRCQEEAARADCILVAGTSATVYPAAALPFGVLERGGTVIEVNPHESELTPWAGIVLEGPAGTVLPQLVAAVRALAAA